MTEAAAGVLFSDFDIFPTPALAFAIVFICRTSSLVHSRRTIFLALAIFAPVFVKEPCITRHDNGNGMTKRQTCTIKLKSNEARTHMPVWVSRARRHPMYLSATQEVARPSASARGYGTGRRTRPARASLGHGRAAFT